MTSTPSKARAVVACVVAAIVVVGAIACGTTGRELRDPAPGATAPPRRGSAAGTLPPTSAAGDRTTFGLASDAWNPGGSIPREYSCEGANISPPLAVFAPPADAVELALVVTDLDVPFVHWVVTGIPPTSASFQAAEVPTGAVEAANSSGAAQYTGPCPPEGEEHTYEFAVYALGSPSGVTEGQDAETAIAAITTSPLMTATITGRFER
jgi:Raf kinase inhibitor-like YbhB/YbcL family protein